jgi:2-iminobutanoate/2-iminopropanoate deaminase
MMKTTITTKQAPAAVGAYNQATMHGNTLYVSGQIAINPETNELVQGSIEDETHQVMKNLEAILHAADMDFTNVLKCSVFVSDMEMYGRVNTVYASYFDAETAPARELVQVANLPKYVNVEISCIAGK